MRFCAAEQASAWMQAAAPVSTEAGLPGDVRLVAQPGTALAPGQQVTFSYSDKGNEELLMLYGAALLMLMVLTAGARSTGQVQG